MVDHLEFSSASHQWNVYFLKVAHDWEMNHFTSLFTLLYFVIVRWDGDDKLCWIPSKRGLFDVIFYYKVLVSRESVAFFAWSATLGRILTINNLKKCRIIVIEWCCMCKKNRDQ